MPEYLIALIAVDIICLAILIFWVPLTATKSHPKLEGRLDRALKGE